jgi:hypothetical protein
MNKVNAYVMYASEFEFVFFLVVERYTLFVEKSHDWHLPSGGAQKAYYHVKEPVLQRSDVTILPILRWEPHSFLFII